MTSRRSKTGKIVFGITSAVLTVVAIGLLVAAVAMAWLYAQRDPDGFLESRIVNLSTEGYAIASEELDFEGVPDEWLPANLVGTFRVKAESSSEPVFIGVGSSSEVDEYLDHVSHARVSNIGAFSKVDYEDVGGSSAAEDPDAQDFWMTTARGNGQQQIEWEAETGEWTIVVMNADASSGVEVAASIAIDNRWLPLAIFVTVVAALLAGVVATVAGLAAFRRSRRKEAAGVNNPELTGIAG